MATSTQLKLDKPQLFLQYFQRLNYALERFEFVFETPGLRNQVLGVESEHAWQLDDTGGEIPAAAQAREHIQASRAWARLSKLFDYAVDGVLSDADAAEDVVLGAAEVLQLLADDDYRISEEWEQLVAMGDARFALDDGDELLLDQLTRLANVDERTVRNAVSAGVLLAEKVEGQTRIMNSSARNWLSARRGFKPTRATAHIVDLASIHTPAQLGAFLVRRRQSLGLEIEQRKLLVLHPLVTPKVLDALEAGAFSLPIDTVFPIADYYQLDRRDLLACVMRIFFRDELAALEHAYKAL